VLGVRPWEWDHLTAADALALARYLDEREKSADG
jgi:hypothetical protein